LHLTGDGIGHRFPDVRYAVAEIAEVAQFSRGMHGLTVEDHPRFARCVMGRSIAGVPDRDPAADAFGKAVLNTVLERAPL